MLIIIQFKIHDYPPFFSVVKYNSKVVNQAFIGGVNCLIFSYPIEMMIKQCHYEKITTTMIYHALLDPRHNYYTYARRFETVFKTKRDVFVLIGYCVTRTGVCDYMVPWW